MKKIILFLIFVLAFIYFIDVNAVWTLDSYLSKTDLVRPTDMEIWNWWFKDFILKWNRNIAWFLWLAAVWTIVYGWFLMALSRWEEEKIKNWKKAATWGVIGFFAVVSAASIIAIIVKFMYWLWW